MDTLHLFTIPKWLPVTLPQELWAIIFYWKWRLEMNAICNPDLMRQILTMQEKCKEMEGYSVRTDHYYISGDTWDTNIILHDFGNGGHILKARPQIIPKCGIEHVRRVRWYPDDFREMDIESIRKILANNHGIICPKTLNWEDTFNLLRTV